MLTVTASSLESTTSPTQLSLFGEEDRIEKHEKVDAALDAIKQKFGKDSVFRAGSIVPSKKEN